MKPYTIIFLLIYFFLLTLGSIVYFSGEHGDFVIWLNSKNSPALDLLFKYGTYFGDGFFLAGVALLLILFKRRHGLILALLGIVQAIVSGLLKRVVFGKTPRPKKYFEDITEFHMVEGVDLNAWYSFPSGHTMTAFSIAAFLMLTYKSSRLTFVFLTMAMIAGLSRIYLLQHFLIDVLVGSGIGVVLAFGIMSVFRNYLGKELEE